MNYVKHLIECQCTLPIFKNNTKPINHKIPVFSKFVDNIFEEKYVMCENCNIIHYVVEVCKSEIKWGNESLTAMINTKEDIKFNLTAQGKNTIVDLLEKNQCHVSDWEMSEYLLESKESGILILNKNEIDNNIILNLVEFQDGNFKLKKEITQRYI